MIELIERFYVMLSQASILLPLAAGWCTYKSISRPFHTFLFLFVIGALVELTGAILKLNDITNMYVYNWMPWAEFCFFTMLYVNHFSGRKVYESFFIVCIAVFTAIGLLDLVIINGFSEMNVFAHGVECILIASYSLLFFYDHFQNEEPVSLTNQPMFWVSAGAFIYFSLNATLFLVAGYLIEHYPDLANAGFNLHGIFNIILHVCIARAFLCFKNDI